MKPHLVLHVLLELMLLHLAHVLLALCESQMLGVKVKCLVWDAILLIATKPLAC